MKRFNVDELLGLIILSGFTIYFYYLISTGKISMFISPRLIKYMIFSLIGFSILTLYQFTKIFTIKSRRPVNKSYMFLFITLIIGCIAAQNGLNSTIVEKKGMELATITENKEIRNIDQDSNSKNTQFKSEKLKLGDEEVIEFSNDNYSQKLTEIEDNFEKYKGRKIIISGFVYKSNDFKKDEFVPARFFMSCCAADSLVIGLMSKWKDAETLNKDEWVRVEGKLDSTIYNDTQSGKQKKVPVILVDKIEKIQKPEDSFIYP